MHVCVVGGYGCGRAYMCVGVWMWACIHVCGGMGVGMYERKVV